MIKTGVYEQLRQRIQEKNIALMGTCAGCILLAKELTENTGDVHPLEAMDMQVERNAFGRQKESFEHDITFSDWKQPYHAVFIRAPVITKVWNDCTPLARIQDHIVAARQGNFLALGFHPELTDDLRIHKYFLAMI
jgi:5'-phosphate synthase pdxT subunit